jgi:hypothetical protein
MMISPGFQQFSRHNGSIDQTVADTRMEPSNWSRVPESAPAPAGAFAAAVT